MNNNQKIKALLLLSGGLDSILAAKLLLEQNIEVEGICFYSNFFNCDLARKAASQLGIKLREIDIKEEFLDFLRKKPKHGYGVGLNPCIDCHALMLKKAGEIMKKERFSFVATGEVLNERPMSQTKQALKIVEKEAGVEGYLLRPLSAKLLELTESEKSGLVDREKLMNISGRSRQKQFELAKKFGIVDYPSPAGGCMLTQEGFVKRIKELMDNKKDFNFDDAELVKIGKHFYFTKLKSSGVSPRMKFSSAFGGGSSRSELEKEDAPSSLSEEIHFEGAWIILGRNKEENEALLKSKQENDIIIEPDNFVGPTAFIRGEIDDERIKKAKELIIKFSPKAAENPKFNEKN